MPNNKNANAQQKDKRCHFCVNGMKDADYKDGALLRKFISSYSKIMPRRRSHLCAKHQRKVAEAIKRARFLAILPFVTK
ncbi:MAG: 30S ribosomal protein S18 [Parcubacteria group bacterium]